MSTTQNGVVRDVTDMGMGGVSAMFATLFTNPLEVVKTRLQLQGELKARGQHNVFYKSVPHGLYVIARTEGFVALQNGLPAMLGFQFFLNTFRLGVYRIAERRGWTSDAAGRPSAAAGGLAAGVGGALGSVAGTPFFLVKTRLQASAARAIAVGHQHAHAGTARALRDIYRAEGATGTGRPSSHRRGTPARARRHRARAAGHIQGGGGHRYGAALVTSPRDTSTRTPAPRARCGDIYRAEGATGLFRGVQPQVPRGAVGSASQMVSFSFAKEFLREQGVTQSPLMLSFLAANLGGVVMTLCLNPFDVVATRLSNQAVDAQNRGKLYSGMTDCFVKMLRNRGRARAVQGRGRQLPAAGAPHGPPAGLLGPAQAGGGAATRVTNANYLRLGPHTVLLLVCWDQLKLVEERLRA
ncbi:hypothetical protein ACJJTC_008569 [Scirpophaga incertulas]